MDEYNFAAWLRARIGSSRNVKTGLARALGVHGSNITKYLQGRTAPSLDKAIAIAKFFGEDPGAIARLAGFDSVSDLAFSRRFGQVPIVGHAAGGPLALAHAYGDGGFPPGVADEYLTVEGVEIDPTDYALRLRGDSLAPAYPEGTLILVSPGKRYFPNSLCVVRAADGRVWLKFVAEQEGLLTLSSLNPASPPFSLRRSDLEWIHPVKWVKLP